jgi:hypothetical protein
MPPVAGDPLGLYERAWRQYVGAETYGVQGSRAAVDLTYDNRAPGHGGDVLAWSSWGRLPTIPAISPPHVDPLLAPCHASWMRRMLP